MPLPDAGVTAIHGALLAAVHVQPAGAVTLAKPLPPAAATLAFARSTLYEQAAACATATALPAIVSDVFLGSVPVLAAIV